MPRIEDISRRSRLLEIMDEKEFEEKELEIVYDNIERINTWLGGDRPSLLAIDRFIKQSQLKTIRIVDIGSGGGGMCRKISKFLKRKGINCEIIGVDINEQSLRIARKNSKSFSNISFQNIDVFSKEFLALKPDIIVSTLTFHHFSNEQIKMLLKSTLQLDNVYFIINDLHRSRWAFYLFKLVSTVFFMHKINKNDGLISILRSFKRHDVEEFNNYVKTINPQITTKLSWKWAFRWLWTIQK